jgi:hypothetical protein
VTASLVRGADNRHRSSPGPPDTDRSADTTTTAESLAGDAHTSGPASPSGNRPWPLKPMAGRDWTRPRRRSPVAAVWEPQLVMGRCAAHIDALYLLAYLYTGEQTMAEAAVVDAVANTAADRAIRVAGPPWVWHILTSHVHPDTGSPGHFRRQREAVALVAAGRSPSHIGALLGITSTQVHSDVWIAIPAIQAHFGLPSPRQRTFTPTLATDAGRPVTTGASNWQQTPSRTHQLPSSTGWGRRMHSDPERRIGRLSGRSPTGSRPGLRP